MSIFVLQFPIIRSTFGDYKLHLYKWFDRIHSHEQIARRYAKFISRQSSRCFRLRATLNARHEYPFVRDGDKNIRHDLAKTTSRENGRFQFRPVIRTAPKDTLRTANRRDAMGDGLPFRFEGFRSECLGHFQSKPKRGDWMGIESRPQRRTTANASVTQTRQERVRPAPHTEGPFSSFAVGTIWQVLHNEWSRVHIPAASRLSDHKRIASAGN